MLKDITKNKIIISKTKYANTFLLQLRGLMFFSKKRFDFALIFFRESESIINSSLHMLFVFFKINVIFLDSKKKVVDIKKNFFPFSFYSPKKPSKYIIELPTKTDISFVKKGDILSF